MARSLGQAVTLEQVIEHASEGVLAGLGCSTVSISRLEPGSGMIRTLINVGDLGPTEERWPEDEVYPLEDFLKLQGMIENPHIRTLTIGQPGADDSEVQLLQSLGKKTATAAPLMVDNRVWGELFVSYVEVTPFGAGDKAYVEVCIAVLESAITKVLRIRDLERLAFLDPLTGLANRRALDEAAATAYGLLAAKNMLRVSVVSIDLNGLKHVNDTAGHAEGDRLITGAAYAIQSQFNRLPGTLTARVGGDEFLVLVPSHSTEIVWETAEAATAAIAALPLGGGASCGIAVATPPHIDESVSALFARADSAQYQSKRSGVLVITESPTGPAFPVESEQEAQTAS